MASKSFDDILAEADQLVRVWTANPKLPVGELTRSQFEEMVATLRTTRSNTQDLKTQLTALVNDGNSQAKEILEITIRARNGARAQFGADSTQYEQLGGTRTSDRKSPRRKGSGGSGTPKG